MDWTKCASYLDTTSLLDVDYCRFLWHNCNLVQQHAYEWLFFIDSAGVEDKGDFYTHHFYPEYLNGD